MTTTCSMPICERPGNYNGFCWGCFGLLTEEEKDHLAVRVRLASNTKTATDECRKSLDRFRRILAQRIQIRLERARQPTVCFTRRLKEWDPSKETAQKASRRRRKAAQR